MYNECLILVNTIIASCVVSIFVIVWFPVNITHWKLFRDIAAFRSVSRGAQANAVAQSAASQHVLELERQFGCDLIDTTKRPLVVTEAGQLYLDTCRDLIRRWEEFESSLNQSHGVVRGTVSVAAIYSIRLSEMTQLEDEFKRRYPEAELAVEYFRPERVYELVTAERFDLGLVSYAYSTREVTAVHWRDEEMAVAVAPGHALAARAEVNVSELAGAQFITFDEGLPIRREIDRYLRRHRVGVDVTHHFDNLPSILSVVADGFGVSIVPARVLKGEVDSGRLVAVPLRPELIRPLGIIHSKRKIFTPAVRGFLELLSPQPVA